MTGLFFGSTSGATESLANDIAFRLGIEPRHIHNVADTAAAVVQDYSTLLLGSSTWEDGTLQSDWEGFLGPLEDESLSGKRVGLFGTADSRYPHTFGAALGTLYDDLQPTGCRFIGAYEPEGYRIVDTPARRDGRFVGLLIDVSAPADRQRQWFDRWMALIQRQAR